MDFLEGKRESNNELIRMYKSSVNDKKRYLLAIINYNNDLAGYTIYKYFPRLKYHYDLYEVAVASMVDAVELYEMGMECGFEEYLIACIKDAITKYLDGVKCEFVCSRKQFINTGDIWYNKNHNTTQTLDTKTIRDSAAKDEYMKVLKKDVTK